MRPRRRRSRKPAKTCRRIRSCVGSGMSTKRRDSSARPSGHLGWRTTSAFVATAALLKTIDTEIRLPMPGTSIREGATSRLRFGEATALRRRDVTDGGGRPDSVGSRAARIAVERSVRYVDGRWLVGDPKTDGARRRRSPRRPPRPLRARPPDALVFGTSSGNYLARSNWGQTLRRAVESVGLPPVRPHELRYIGATLAAGTGATTRSSCAASATRPGPPR